MTSPTQPKSTSIPAVIVYGMPTSPELTQASWFRAEDKEAAKGAAVGLKFSVIDIQTDAEKALTLGVHEGVLKGSGRMIIGSVSSEVYRRIEEYARKGAGADPAPKPESALGSIAGSPIEQTINTGSTGGVVGASAKADLLGPTPNPWQTLRVGSRVLAAFWNEKREFDGFWLATVKRIDKGEFTLEWSDAPEYPTFKTAIKNVALPHPEFRPSGK